MSGQGHTMVSAGRGHARADGAGCARRVRPRGRRARLRCRARRGSASLRPAAARASRRGAGPRWSGDRAVRWEERQHGSARRDGALHLWRAGGTGACFRCAAGQPVALRAKRASYRGRGLARGDGQQALRACCWLLLLRAIPLCAGALRLHAASSPPACRPACACARLGCGRLRARMRLRRCVRAPESRRARCIAACTHSVGVLSAVGLDKHVGAGALMHTSCRTWMSRRLPLSVKRPTTRPSRR